MNVQAQTGGFVSMLGKDTAFVERYVQAGNRIEGTLVSHFAARPGAPSPVLVKYAMTLNDDGTVATYEVAPYLADGTRLSGASVGQRMRFTGDSVIRETTVPPAAYRNAAVKGTLPILLYSQLFIQLGIQRAQKDQVGRYNVYSSAPAQTSPLPVNVRFIGNDSAEVETGVTGTGAYYNGYRIDRAGRIIRGDGSKSTWKFVITPVKDLDAAAIASAWAANEAAGRASGMMSPTDTLAATVGAANIQIIYSRPGKRDRQIWGGLVPWGEVWRFGANAATMFTTDKDLDIGGSAIPAGTYTLWLLPMKGQSLLIVNKETKQWGTQYHVEQDLVRIPVETQMGLSTVEERFTLAMVGDKLMCRWDNGEYGVKVSASAAPQAHDTIDGTKWLGRITSSTGATPYGLEFRRTPRGALFLIEYLPVMHLYSQVVSRVTVRNGEYLFEDLPGTARLDGNTLRGTALFAGMPFALEQVAQLPTPTDTTVPIFAAGPTPRWTRTLGAAAWASPAVRDGSVYVGTVDGRVHALRARDGKEGWTWSDSTPIYGDALVTNDAVFVVNDRTELARLNRANGVLAWRVPLDSARRRPAALPDDDTFNHRTATPVLDGGLLFVGSTDGHILAIDPASGTVKWRTDGGAKICASVAVAGDRVIVGTMDGSLLALRRADGGVVWRRKLAAGIVSAPVIYRETAIVGARDYLMHAVRLADGGDVWTQHFWASWVESAPRIVDGVLYVGSSDLRAVRALDPATGSVQWSTDVFGAAWGSPVVTGDALYVGVAAVNGYMIVHHPSLVALDKRTGAIRWRVGGASTSGIPVSGYAGAIAYANRSLYAAGLDGRLVALTVP